MYSACLNESGKLSSAFFIEKCVGAYLVNTFGTLLVRPNLSARLRSSCAASANVFLSMIAG